MCAGVYAGADVGADGTLFSSMEEVPMMPHDQHSVTPRIEYLIPVEADLALNMNSQQDVLVLEASLK